MFTPHLPQTFRSPLHSKVSCWLWLPSPAPSPPFCCPSSRNTPPVTQWFGQNPGKSILIPFLLSNPTSNLESSWLALPWKYTENPAISRCLQQVAPAMIHLQCLFSSQNVGTDPHLGSCISTLFPSGYLPHGCHSDGFVYKWGESPQTTPETSQPTQSNCQQNTFSDPGKLRLETHWWCRMIQRSIAKQCLQAGFSTLALGRELVPGHTAKNNGARIWPPGVCFQSLNRLVTLWHSRLRIQSWGADRLVSEFLVHGKAKWCSEGEQMESGQVWGSSALWKTSGDVGRRVKRRWSSFLALAASVWCEWESRGKLIGDTSHAP